MQDLVPVLTSYEGSISRRTFWTAAIVLMVAGLVLGFVPYVGALATMLLLYPWTCLAMQRLRDMGRPAGLAFVPAALCVVSALLGIAMTASVTNPALFGVAMMLGGITVLVGMIAAIVGLAFLLWIGLTPGKGEDADTLSRDTRR